MKRNIFLVCLLTFVWGACATAWAEEIRTPKQKRVPIVFNDVAYDFELQRVLGMAVSGGSDINECLHAAHQIKEGDDNSWFKAWYALAERVRAEGEASLNKGHKVSAREAFLRASTYYRSAPFFLHGTPKDARIMVSWKKSRTMFRQAAKLMDFSVEVVRIPYEGTTLPGYVLLPDASGKPRKTIILQTGFDGTGEELYAEGALFALRRGYAVIIFEGPGQGGALREQGLTFRPDWEKVITPVVDYALTRKEVDPHRIALMGYSMGGYLAPRGAAFEHRLRALVANPGSYNMFGHQEPSPEIWEDMRKYPDVSNKDMHQTMEKDTGFRWFVNNGMFTTGKKTPVDFMLFWKKFTMKGLADKITCPTLVIASTGDHFYTLEDEKKLYNKLTCPKTLLVFDGKDSATTHCQMGALMVSNQRIFDWLDETMAR